MSVLALFAKPPVAGRVKTRLGRDLGMDRAAAVYRAFVHDLVSAHRARAYPAVVYSASPGFPDALAQGLPVRLQRGDDLGARMQAAFADGVQVLIGSDLPTVGPADVHAALAALDAHDLVLGPALDGGYWLIAMRTPQPVFDGVAWSTGAVLAQTRAHASRLGLRVHLLDARADVDTLADLLELATQPDLPPRTAAALAALVPGRPPG